MTAEALNNALVEFNQSRKKLQRILITEPTKTVGKFLAGTVAKHGYQTLVAYSGKEALEKAGEFAPEILITSLELADMTGYDLYKRMIAVENLKAPYTILLTSDVTDDILQKGMEAGITHFLKKPVNETELTNSIIGIERSQSEKRGEKILIVDDSLSARSAVHRELASGWDKILTAENGLEGLELAIKERPDIITMDVEMPEMDGLTACKRLKDYPETENIPVIFITSLDSPEFRQKGFDAGGVEYFTKPFKTGALASFVKMLCESKNFTKLEKVMVVDDSKTTRHIFKYFLEKNGYRVYTYKDGREAVEALGNVEPDIVVTDCYMPGLDGFGVIRHMRQDRRWAKTPAIMVTSSTSKTDVIKAFAEGASDYITKPFDESEVIARINLHLSNRKLVRNLEAEQNKLRDTLDHLHKANATLEKLAHDLEEANTRLEALSQADGLTGLANRRHFDGRLANEWNRATRERLPLSLIMMDIDHFKKYNDGYGHLAGDDCIRKVADCIKRVASRSSDMPARYGGEEFAVILSNTDEAGAGKVAEQIRRGVEELNLTHEYSPTLPVATLSLGHATVFPPAGAGPEGLIKMADAALYASKKDGRNRVSAHRPD
ncbi:MAG: response regulator [Nitrospinae bacterium]|nr:response regulator [Nitrospinota bacterium]